MKTKVDPIVSKIFQDTTTQYLIQQQLQDIYNCLDNNITPQEAISKLNHNLNTNNKSQPNIIYMSQEELELLEEPKQDNKLQEEINYENI
jgi:hypothetical protein